MLGGRKKDEAIAQVDFKVAAEGGLLFQSVVFPLDFNGADLKKSGKKDSVNA